MGSKRYNHLPRSHPQSIIQTEKPHKLFHLLKSTMGVSVQQNYIKKTVKTYICISQLSQQFYDSYIPIRHANTVTQEYQRIQIS